MIAAGSIDQPISVMSRLGLPMCAREGEQKRHQNNNYARGQSHSVGK